VADLHARQVCWQWCATWLGLGCVSWFGRSRAQGLELGFQSGQIGIQCLVKQTALIGLRMLTLGCKLQAFVAGNLVREQVDLGLLEVDLLILVHQLGHQALGQGAQLLRVHVLELVRIDDHGRHHRCQRDGVPSAASLIAPHRVAPSSCRMNQ